MCNKGDQLTPKMAQHWIRPNPDAKPQPFSDEDMAQQLNALDPELGNLYLQNVSRMSNPSAIDSITRNFYIAIKTKDAQHIQSLKKRYAIPSRFQQFQQPLDHMT